MATKRTIGFLTMSLLLGSAAMPVLAQDTPPAGQPGQPGQGGRPDPAQFRQRFMDRIKEQLGSSDDEFKVLQPKIEQLFVSQRHASVHVANETGPVLFERRAAPRRDVDFGDKSHLELR